MTSARELVVTSLAICRADPLIPLEEQFDGVEARPNADVYSFGKLLVYMLTGQTDIDMVQFPTWRQLIGRCCAQTADERPSIANVLKDIEAIQT